MSAKNLNLAAGVLFLVNAAYTYWHTSADWPMTIFWAAIGAAFISFGLTGRKATRPD